MNDIRRTGSAPAPRPQGASLIVVLGLLAVLTVLAAAFALCMRTERLSGKNCADEVRARHLIQTALIRATEDIDSSMLGYCYPWWGTRPPSAADAMCSAPAAGAAPGSTMLRGEASNAIPMALRTDAVNAAGYCGWTNIVANGRIQGRIAYVVINCSGLLDANYLGQMCDGPATNLVAGLVGDIHNVDAFYDDTRNHVRYETLTELTRLNTGVFDPVSNLFVYSYDPGPDVYFEDPSRLGCRDIQLVPKLDINSCTSYPSYTDPAFLTNYWAPLTNRLCLAGFTNNPEAIAWNILNYLDPDRIPRNGTTAWPNDDISEAVPLINEIVLQSSSETNHQFVVELWFPFYPVTAAVSNDFNLEIGVFVSPTPGSRQTVMNFAFPYTTNTIGDMAFGAPTEFLCFTNVFATLASISPSNPVYFLARVLQGSNVVDEVAEYDPADTNRQLMAFVTNALCYSVNDPRANGQTKFWLATTPTNTLGQMNSTCDPWADNGQGLPIFHRDGPMQGIGEIGHVYCPPSSFGFPYPRFWQNIDLLSGTGAALLDWLTVRATHSPTSGLVALGTQQKDVLRVLFDNTVIGYTNTATTTCRPLSQSEQFHLADALVAAATNAPFLSFRDAFDALGIDPWLQAQWKGDLKEDAFRHLPELVTFRQNLFTVLLAAQPLAPDGITPTAEKRAMAIVYRDSYTGKSFVRLFQWLTR